MLRRRTFVSIALLLLVALPAFPASAVQGPVPDTQNGRQPAVNAGPLGPSRPLADGNRLYLTSLDIGDATFAVYDPATNTWATLAPFDTGCQMAVSAIGQLYAFDVGGWISVYDPSTDSWGYIVDGPPGASGYECNLEITNEGVFLYTEWSSSTLWYYSAGVWHSMALPFIANAMGDYDPLNDQYVVGEAWTTNAHLIDVHTWTITNFYSSLGNGECARFSSILNNRYYFEAGGSSIHSFDLANPGLPPYDHGVYTSWYGSSAADRSYQIVYNASLDGTQLWAFDPATNTATPLAGGPYLWHSSLAFADVELPVPRIHVGAIAGYLTPDPYGRPVLRAMVQAMNEGGGAMGGVMVDATITYPGGQVSRPRYTHPNGWARFHWGANPGTGTWTLCVDNLTLAGYVYSPGDNVVTCADWVW